LPASDLPPPAFEFDEPDEPAEPEDPDDPAEPEDPEEPEEPGELVEPEPASVVVVVPRPLLFALSELPRSS
jgi:hypothetical protein